MVVNEWMGGFACREPSYGDWEPGIGTHRHGDFMVPELLTGCLLLAISSFPKAKATAGASMITKIMVPLSSYSYSTIYLLRP